MTPETKLSNRPIRHSAGFRLLAPLALLLATALPDQALAREQALTEKGTGDRREAQHTSPLPEQFGPAWSLELGIGWLALPRAPVCDTSGCERGDGTPWLELSALVPLAKRLALSADVGLGLSPTQSIEHQPREERVHSRSYFAFELTGRYFPFLSERWQTWLGPGVGLAVHSDRFMGEPLVQNQYQRIGDPGAQLITQGLSFFLAAEVAYRLSPHWALIGSLRGGGILFPKIPQTTALGDIASVSGLVPRVSAVLGLAVGIGR